MAKKKQNKRIKVNLQPWEFNPTTLRGLDLKDLRTLYSTKRDIGQKRLKRLQQSEFRTNQLALDYKSGIPTLKQIRTTSEKDPEFEKNILTYELTKLNTWLENEYTKIGKLKELKSKSLATLHEHGYTWVTSENYMEFVGFEDYLRQVGLDKIYDSEQIVNAVSSGKGEFNTNQLRSMFEEYLSNGNRLPEEYFMRR